MLVHSNYHPIDLVMSLEYMYAIFKSIVIEHVSRFDLPSAAQWYHQSRGRQQ